MKNILTFLFLLCSVSCLAQSQQKMGNFQVDSFPTIGFEYTCYTAEQFSKESIAYLKENGKDCQIINFIYNKQSASELQNSCTLFLWEDMHYYGDRMHDFVQRGLMDFIDAIDFSQQDKVAVATYSRTATGWNTLVPLTEGFVSDKDEIKSAILSHTLSQTYKSETQADIYRALLEGLVLLDKEKNTGAKSIVLFTAGRPLPGSAAGSAEEVKSLAQRLHIPLGIVVCAEKKGTTGFGSNLSEQTNGNYFFYTNLDQHFLLQNDLAKIYTSQKYAYKGNTYRITFKSRGTRGGQSSSIQFKMSGFEELSAILYPPAFSLNIWISEHLLLVVFIGVIILLMIGACIVMIVYNAKKRKKEREERLRQDIETQKQMDKSQRFIDNIQQKEFLAKQELRMHFLQTEMQRKNLIPRLQCSSAYPVFFEMRKAEILLGRDAVQGENGQKNDWIINDASVSRFHAKIVFDGTNGFNIEDTGTNGCGSLNGVFINGRRINRKSPIQNGDCIGLGNDVKIYFSI